MSKQKSQKINVSGKEITIQQFNDKDYISLSDMAREDGGIERIRNWMRNRDTIEFLSTWEEIHNPDFNVVQMHHITKDAGYNRFIMSPKQWIENTNAVGMVSKGGRYGGVYGHKDIAYHFGMWLSPKFSLLVIKEFDRLKEEEYSREKQTWNYQRFLAKVNYRLHTDTIRDHILPQLKKATKGKEWLIYADEADLLNMAVFGKTAKQWREENPELAKKGNMRDHSEILQLNVLANLETLNAFLIEQGLEKDARFELLSKTAFNQYYRLMENENRNRLNEGEE